MASAIGVIDRPSPSKSPLLAELLEGRHLHLLMVPQQGPKTSCRWLPAAQNVALSEICYPKIDSNGSTISPIAIKSAAMKTGSSSYVSTVFPCFFHAFPMSSHRFPWFFPWLLWAPRPGHHRALGCHGAQQRLGESSVERHPAGHCRSATDPADFDAWGVPQITRRLYDMI